VEVPVKLEKVGPLFLLVLTLLAGSSQQALAQSAVTVSEIQRLQDSISDVSRDLTQMPTRDAALAAQLQKELDEANEEAIYLKVKLRKREPVARSEFREVFDNVERIRSRARGMTGRDSTGVTSPGRRVEEVADIPAGTEFDVRLEQPLSSATAKPEDRFEVKTVVDVRDGDRVLVPAGSTVRGVVNSVQKANRFGQKGSITVTFDRLTISGRNYLINATVTEAIESEGIRGDAAKIGTAAGVGAIIGGILGGLKGAIAGILIGGGGTIVATDPKDVELPAGTILRLRFDSGVNLAR
jgi:hypothetical protein